MAGEVSIIEEELWVVTGSFKAWMGAYSMDTAQIPTSGGPTIFRFVVIDVWNRAAHHKMVKGWFRNMRGRHGESVRITAHIAQGHEVEAHPR